LERFINDFKYNWLKGGFRWYGYEMINIETLFWKMVKHKFRNSQREAEVVDEAIETIFDSSFVDLKKLFEVFLQNPSKETKMLFKMVLTEQISKTLAKKNWNENYKCYLYHCESYIMHCSTIEFAILDIIIGPEKDTYKAAVQKIVETVDDVLENYGPFPYIELVHELVEQFDDIKHDFVNIHHQNILKMKNFMEKRVWYEVYFLVSNRSNEIDDRVKKSLYCLEEKNPLSLLMKNIQSEISREDLDSSLQQLKVAAKELLTEFRGKVLYVVKESLDQIKNVLYLDDWIELFMVGRDESLVLTHYLKNGEDGLRKFVNLRLKVSDFEAIQKKALLLIQYAKRFVYSQAKKQAEIFKPLWQDIPLTPAETETVQTLYKEIGDAVDCFVCKLSVNCEC